MASGIFFTHADHLPVLHAEGETPLGLGEGNTPLLRLRHIVPDEVAVWVKYEGLNPTGSFKDRGMVVAIAAARAEGAGAAICASTGNTSASAAAYAAHAGMAAIVLIPAGKVAAGKIAQAVAHGAHLIQIEGNFDDAMRAVRAFADSGKVAVVNSINPYRLQGQKTAALEVVADLGAPPDFHALPVGNAGNISAYWMGYREAATAAARADGADAKKPAMLGYQADGAAPFVYGTPVEKPTTVATAIRIGNPQSYDKAVAAAAESGGAITAVGDDEILAAQSLLAAKEGIFCEPASAASVAGVRRDIHSGIIPAGARVVCTLTGHGLKDPDIFPPPPVRPLPVADLESAIARIIDER